MINKNTLVLAAGICLSCNHASLAMAQQCNTSPSSQHFISDKNGTVTDQRTGLMWKTCLEGQKGPKCSGKPTALQWQA
ncbi:MAG: hypothetical protein ACK4RS_03120, partial [Thiothrix sp.]